jgi:mannosyl-oligosaccharide alpha-1,2-mannosidase
MGLINFKYRWALLTSLCLAFAFFLLQHRRLYFDGTPIPAPAPQAKGDNITVDKVDWANLPFRYPISEPASLPSGISPPLPKIQHDFGRESEKEAEVRLQRRETVKACFSRFWEAYKDRAWMKDELLPISGSGQNNFGGWGATLVDTLDTLFIMDLGQDLADAIQAVSNIDFSRVLAAERINIFETTIRFLGGLLAAYDLTHHPVLFGKAIELGELLYHAFDTPNHMPVLHWDWRKAAEGDEQLAEEQNYLAELGSLSLEFTRLSQNTQDAKWYDVINRITEVLVQQRNLTKLPGMWPVWVNPRAEDLFSTNRFTLGGTSDSVYEYFAKEFILLNGLSPIYRDLYEQAMSTAIDNLLFRPMSSKEDSLLMFGTRRIEENLTSTLDAVGQHLSCYTSGMLALGGRIFGISHHVDIAVQLLEGCIWAYKAMPSGIMPEVFHVVPCDSLNACDWDQDKWQQAVYDQNNITSVEDLTPEEAEMIKSLPAGFTKIDDKRYMLRPEAVESAFVLYRITGNKKYQDAAWDMFLAIQNRTQTEIANAALLDVTQEFPEKEDRAESFWTAETLKYLYLIFSEPELISLDEYVFNTEAHPFKRPT